MADAIGIQIKNMAQIKMAFGRAPALMAKELNTAIKKTTLFIMGKSMVNTPVDTGRLRSSTYSRFGNLQGEVGTNTNYDVFVHNGTRFMKARPYLLNAVNESQRQVDDFFTKAVDNVLNQIGKMT